jgi:acetoin utilization deacetylase AcuC-like enzyme
MILVAAGFDGHVEDPMSPLQITERSFEWIVRCLIQLRSRVSEPPLLFALEGGYSPQALTHCVKAVLKALTEDPEEPLLPLSPTPVAEALFEKAVQHHVKHRVWVD